MTGITNLKSPKLKLSFVWDKHITFIYFKQLGV